MPLLLEVGLSCEKFQTHPGTFGLDEKDPRVIRAIRMCLSVYHAATARKNAKKKVEWAKANPDAEQFLRWASRGKSNAKMLPGEVSVEIPTRG